MTPHRPHIDPTSTPHQPHIDPTSTLHRPHIDPTSTPHRPHLDLRESDGNPKLVDTEGFDWLESTELAIDKRKFLLNRLYQKQPIRQDED